MKRLWFFWVIIGSLLGSVIVSESMRIPAVGSEEKSPTAESVASVVASSKVRIDSTPPLDWNLESVNVAKVDVNRVNAGKTEGAFYSPMHFRGDDAWYGSAYFVGGEVWCRVGRDWQHPGEAATSVRTFTAPRDGTVEISGMAAKYHVAPETDGVTVSIRHNDETVWTAELEGGDAAGVRFFLRLPVLQGDVFRFLVGKRGSIVCDTTRFAPTISYIDDGETYSAADDFDTADESPRARWNYEWLPESTQYVRPKPDHYGENFDAMIQYEWLREDAILPGDFGAYRAAAEKHLAQAQNLLDDLADALDPATLEQFEERLAELSQSVPTSDPRAEEIFYATVRGLKRKILFANPLYQFGPMLFVQRVPSSYSHLVMQYFGWRARPGGGIFVLEKPGESLVHHDLFDGRLAAGSVLEPRLSFDASRVVFSWVDLSSQREFDPHQVWHTDSDEGFYHVWSANTDGSDLRCLTTGSFDDITPTFLPDGRIVFSSTRRKGYARCFWWGFGRRWHVYTIHSMNADGSDIKTLSWHDTNEWFPEISPSGLIVYSRWDYIDRDAVTHQNLWSMRPDGTNPSAVWGNATPTPHCTFQAKSIPGSNKYIFTASAHHSVTGGSLAILDPSVARDGESALLRVTPQIPFPESESLTLPEYYESPTPLSEKYFLVSWSAEPLRWEGEEPQNAAALGIYAFDLFGNRELIFRSPTLGATNPTPMVARPSPPILPSQLPSEPSDWGEMSITDIYQGLGDGVSRGSIREVRVVQLFPKTTRDADNPPIGLAREENGRAILGTVPVEPDGSAYFRVPARTPFYLQALDAQGYAYQTMRSLTYLQPGEKISCTGCHENREASAYSVPEFFAPESTRPLAFRRTPSEILPGRLGGRPFGYPEVVQPILDRHCTVCHNSERNEGGFDLTGPPVGEEADAFTQSYIALMSDRNFWGEGTNPANAAEALVPRFGARNQIQVTEPGGMYGAIGSRLLRMLRAGHEQVVLTDEEMCDLATWIDLNGIFYGVDNPEGQEAIRAGRLAPMPEIE